MVESMVEGNPNWTLGASQGIGECWAWNIFHPQPWWWCKAHIRVVGSSDGLWQGIPSANASKICHPLETFVAPDVHHTVLILGFGLLQDVMNLLENVLDAFNKPSCFVSLGLCMCGLCLCSHMRHGNINQTQWLKPQTHLKGTSTSCAMESFVISMLHIGKALIPGSWMLGVVHVECVHCYLVVTSIWPSVWGWNEINLVSLVSNSF